MGLLNSIIKTFVGDKTKKDLKKNYTLKGAVKEVKKKVKASK